MICGFDYGTSNCAIGIMQDNRQNKTVNLLKVDGAHSFMPSALYALSRELICEQVAHGMSQSSVSAQELQTYLGLRKATLQAALRVRNEFDLQKEDEVMFVGHKAFEQYFNDPKEGYFIKSPKSFLGASGLRADFVHIFEDIVTAMMQTIKRRAESSLQANTKDVKENNLTQTVIGRPVNFQGINAEQSNQQALTILSQSAKRAGFTDIEFLYEPIAAGLAFERNLTENKIVLVVDIGGGTSDCAMVRMGPDHIDKVERRDDFLGHTGQRIGGNDLDIRLATDQLMPLFGMHAALKSGKPMPTKTFFDAVATNDAGALGRFSSLETGLYLDQLQRDCSEPQLIRRLISLRERKQNQQLVRNAEEAKIVLSENSECDILLDFVEPNLSAKINQTELHLAIRRPLEKITELMHEAVQQAGVSPDVIFITGGSARSPIIRSIVSEQFPNIPILDGDHFGIVAAGLTEWAQKIYR
ncbi:MAG: molecular chaperone [Oleibacter sp.]|nr:molecular chaperone [Thalassolituus sp.]